MTFPNAVGWLPTGEPGSYKLILAWQFQSYTNIKANHDHCGHLQIGNRCHWSWGMSMTTQR